MAYGYRRSAPDRHSDSQGHMRMPGPPRSTNLYAAAWSASPVRVGRRFYWKAYGDSRYPDPGSVLPKKNRDKKKLKRQIDQ
jgi:hypothetical protein